MKAGDRGARGLGAGRRGAPGVRTARSQITAINFPPSGPLSRSTPTSLIGFSYTDCGVPYTVASRHQRASHHDNSWPPSDPVIQGVFVGADVDLRAITGYHIGAEKVPVYVYIHTGAASVSFIPQIASSYRVP